MITNTEAKFKSPIGVENLLLAAALPGGIEAMEAQGQQELVLSDFLPTKGLKKELYEKLGFVIGEPIEGDEMFTQCKLPEGWTKQASDHAMWSYLYDEKGRRRAGIFYKAAFYDRSAYIALTRWCEIAQRYWKNPDEFLPDWDADYTHLSMCVKTADRQILFESKPYDKMDFVAEDLARTEVENQLIAAYPDHADPTAYWS